MARDVPHGRSADGRSYVCGACGAPIPDGALVAANWSAAGKATAARVTNLDGDVLHECGPAIKGDGRG